MCFHGGMFATTAIHKDDSCVTETDRSDFSREAWKSAVGWIRLVLSSYPQNSPADPFSHVRFVISSVEGEQALFYTQ